MTAAGTNKRAMLRMRVVCVVVLATLASGAAWAILSVEEITRATAGKAAKVQRTQRSKVKIARATRAERAAAYAQSQQREAQDKRRLLDARIAKLKTAQAKLARQKAAKQEEARLASKADIILRCVDEKGSPISDLALRVDPTYADPGLAGRVLWAKTYPAVDYKPEVVEVRTDETGNATVPGQRSYLHSYEVDLVSDDSTESSSASPLSLLAGPEWEMTDDSARSYSFAEFYKPLTIELKFKRLKGDIAIDEPQGGVVKLGATVVSDKIPCKLAVPLDLGGRGLKLAVQRETEAGTMAGTAEIPTLYPYETAKIGRIDLTIQAIKQARIVGDIDIGMNQEQVKQALGEPAKDFETMIPNTVKPGANARSGSHTWEYPKHGLALQIRNSKLDVIKMLSAEAGKVAGISVGDDSLKLADLGEEGPGESASTKAYLDNGIRFEKSHLRIAAIEIARKKDLLVNGTPAFVRSPRPKFYITKPESKEPGMQEDMSAIVKAMFDAIGPYVVVASEDAADFKVSVSLNQCSCTREDKREERKQKDGSKRYVDMVYLSGSASASLDVEDTDSGASIISTSATGSSSDSLEAEKFSNQYMLNAKSDAVKSATYGLMTALYNVKPVVGRVIAVDYTANKVRINLGSRDGIQARSSSQRPTEFRLEIDGEQVLTNKEHYVEVTEDVGEDYAVLECCSKNMLGKTRTDWNALLQIPNPASARIVAVMKPRHGNADHSAAGGGGSSLWH